MSEPTEMPYELESLLRADGEGPAPRIDAVAAQRMIAQAIDGVDAAAVPPVAPLRLRRYGFLLAAALLITGSAAAMFAARRARVDDASVSQLAAPRVQAAKPLADPAPQPAVTATDAPTQPAAGEMSAAGDVRDAVPEQPRAAQIAVPGNGEGGVQDLLRRANHLRGDGRYRAAERTYLRVLAQSPDGAAAYSARVAAAALRIERLDDARGALQLYREALRAQPHGALAPEIHEGMALAFRKLAEPARERSALRALLDEQPDGPAAERARTRLQQLDAPAR